MRLWRICKERWAHLAFDGEGARQTGGRWNHKGTGLAYASASLSLAALELFVHLDPNEMPDDLMAVSLLIPDDVTAHEITTTELPQNWRDFPAPAELKDIGTRWVQSQSTLLLQVPSAIVPQENNVLINPAHPQFAESVIGPAEPFQFDPRMWK